MPRPNERSRSGQGSRNSNSNFAESRIVTASRTSLSRFEPKKSPPSICRGVIHSMEILVVETGLAKDRNQDHLGFVLLGIELPFATASHLLDPRVNA